MRQKAHTEQIIRNFYFRILGFESAFSDFFTSGLKIGAYMPSIAGSEPLELSFCEVRRSGSNAHADCY